MRTTRTPQLADPSTDPAWERYWDWFAVALFLLLAVDLLLTMAATSVHGLEAEANPVMRWILARGFVVIVVAHLATLLVVAAAFAQLLRCGKRLRGSARTRFMRSTELWLGGLIALGLFVYANNLSVIILGESLF